MSTEHLGPIDFALVEFVDGRFDGSIADELLRLVAEGTVRIMDLVFISKDADGDVVAIEVDELDESQVGLMTSFGAVTAPLVGEEDLLAAGELLPAGAAALMVVWENAWANPLLVAIARAGGEIIASQRLAHADVLAALEA